MSPEGYRTKCIEAKGNHCTVCGKQDSVVVHHLNGERDDNRLDNLIPVCRSHHMQIHYDNDKLKRYTSELPQSKRFDVSEGTRTTIQVSETLADELHDRKGRGDTYDDVLRRLLIRATE